MGPSRIPVMFTRIRASKARAGAKPCSSPLPKVPRIPTTKSNSNFSTNARLLLTTTMEQEDDNSPCRGWTEAIVGSPASAGASPEQIVSSEAHDEHISGNQQDETDSLRPNEWDFRINLITPSME